MTRSLPLLALLIGMAHPSLAIAEQWQVRPFIETITGGPDYGLALQSGGGLHHLCGTEQGSLFLASGQRIDRIDVAGQRWPVAGDGFEGLIDGPARIARFRMGVGAYYRSHNLACANDQLLFVGDTGNHRVRRIQRRENGWLVDSVAGGGSMKSAAQGTTLKGANLDLGNTFSIALPDPERLIIATRLGAWSIHIPSDQARWLGFWPATTALKQQASPQLNLMMGDADRLGNSYFVSRTPDVVLRVTQKGALEHFAGIVARHPKPHHIGDGAPREVYFDTPNSLVVAPDGSAVYVCGGDEYDVRRVPTAAGALTQTLMRNGRWGHATLHPNKSRGPAVYTPTATGTLMPQGALSVMMVSPLYGRDWEGNLYAGVVPWVGMSQFIQGAGLLPTHSFQLFRRSP